MCTEAFCPPPTSRLDYLIILSDQIHLIVADDNVPITTANVITECHEEQSSQVEHLIWPSQTPGLNIIEH